MRQASVNGEVNTPANRVTLASGNVRRLNPGASGPVPEMASNPVAGFPCQPNGESPAGRVSGSDRSGRLLSESDVGPAVKSLARLCSRSEGERAEALEELSQEVLVCLGLDRPGSARLSKQTLLHLLRLSRSCPLQEVRERATELLRAAQVMLYCYSQSFLLNVCRSAGKQKKGPTNLTLLGTVF